MKPSRLLLLGLLALLACGPTPASPPAYVESFDTRCGDLPCGWTETQGTAGQATYVADASLPGEHGIALTGSGVTVRGPAGPSPVFARLRFESMEARLSARCDADASLTVSVAIVQVGEGGVGTGVSDTLTGSATPAPGSSTATFVTLTGAMALSDGGFTAVTRFGGSAHIEIEGVSISKAGAGQCVIDDLRIGDFGTLDNIDPGTRC